jgi:hypothetical protein
MTRSPAEVIRDAYAIANEPLEGDEPLARLGERVGVDPLDVDFVLTASAFVAGQAKNLDIAEDVKEGRGSEAVASLATIFVFGFLTGAWWQQQKGGVRWPEENDE